MARTDVNIVKGNNSPQHVLDAEIGTIFIRVGADDGRMFWIKQYAGKSGWSEYVSGSGANGFIPGSYSFSELRDLSGSVGDMANCYGRLTARDGGDGIFVCKSGSPTDDDGVVLVNSSAGIFWERLVFASQVSPSWWGFKGDYATDDYAAFQAALNYAETISGTVIVPGTGAKVSQSLVAPSKVTVVSRGREFRINQTTAKQPVVKFRSGFQRGTWEGFHFIAATDADAVEVRAQTVGSSVDRPRFVNCVADVSASVNKTCTVDAGTDTVTCTSHGFANDDMVMFTTSGGSIPTGLSRRIEYFVIGATTDTFQVSLTSGGAAVNVTSAGSAVRVGKVVGGFAFYPTSYDIYFPELLHCETTGAYGNNAACGTLIRKIGALPGGCIGVLMIGGWNHNCRNGIWDNNSSGSFLFGTEFDGATDLADSLGQYGGGTYIKLRGIATQNSYLPRFEPSPSAQDYSVDFNGVYNNVVRGAFDGHNGQVDYGTETNTLQGWDGSTFRNRCPEPTFHKNFYTDTITEQTASARVSLPSGIKCDVNVPPSGIHDVTGDLVRVTKTGAAAAFSAGNGTNSATYGYDHTNNLAYSDTTSDGHAQRIAGTNKLITSTVGLLARTAIHRSRGSDVASAASITCDPTSGDVFAITGSTAIDYMLTTNWQCGSIVTLIFVAGLTVNHGSGAPGVNYAAFKNSTGAARVYAAGDVARYMLITGTSLSTFWQQV